MRKIIPLIFSVFSSLALIGQADGGWGNCEFATVVAMNAYNPSGSAFSCKKVYVQATDDHYYWDGSAWVQITDDQNASEVPFTPAGTISATNVQAAIEEAAAESLDNIYNTDGTLTGNRAVTQSNFDINFDLNTLLIDGSANRIGIGTASPSTKLDVNGIGLFRNGSIWNGSGSGANGQLQFGLNSTDTYRHSIKTRHDSSNNNYNRLDFFVWEIGQNVNDLGTRQAMTVSAANSGSVGIGVTVPTAKLHVDGGDLRFSAYGTPTTYDATPLKLLGVEANGDVVQTTIASLGGLENIYNINGTLTGNRAVTLNNFDLNFDANSLVIDGSANRIGIGTNAPSTKLDVVGNGLFRNGSNYSGGGSGANGQLQFGYNNTSTYRHNIRSRHNNSNNNYNGLDFYVWEVGQNINDIGTSHAMTVSAANSGSVGIGVTVPTAKLHVDGGDLRFSSYGTPTTYDGTPLKILGVQANGDVVQTTLADIGGTENIYNTNGTLDANRTVGLGGNNLTFDGSSDVIIQSDGDVGIGGTPTTEFDVRGTGLFRNGSNYSGGGSGANGQLQFGYNNTNTYRHSIRTRHDNGNNNYNGIDFFVWEQGVDAPGDLGTRRAMTVSAQNSGSVGIGVGAPTAKLHVDGGDLRFSSYGTPTTYDGSPIKILGVEANGDVVQTTLANIGGTENIYNINGTLTGNRAVTLNNFDLNFDANSLVIDGSANRIGIGTNAPSTKLDVVGNGLFRNGSDWSGGGSGASGQIQLGYNNTNTYRHSIRTRHNNSNNNYNGIDFFVWEIGQNVNDLGTRQAMTVSAANSGSVGIGVTVPTAKLHVDGGDLRFSAYGTPTTYDATPLKLLGVEANGDVVQTTIASIGGLENIYNINGTLTGNRAVTLNNFDLNFDANSLVIDGSANRIGIGTAAPSTKLDVVGNGLFRNGSDWSGGGSGASGQLQFGFNNTNTYRHSIRTRHNNSNNNYNGIDFFVWEQGVDAVGDLGTRRAMTISAQNSGSVGIGVSAPTAKLHVDGGDLRFSSYGTPTTYDGTPLKILGVQANGDVVQTAFASIVNTDDQTASEVPFTPGGTISSTNVQAAIEEVASESLDNIYNTSAALTADRVVDLNSNDLTFDGTGTGDVIIQADGDVGIGTTTPIGQFNVVNTEDVDAFTFSSASGTTGEKDVFTIIDSDAGGGGQDHSSALKVLKNANINTLDEGYSLVELTYTGADPTNNKYWISGRKTNEGAPVWGVNISDNQLWSSGGLLLNATGAADGTYSGGNVIVEETTGKVGIGTITPGAQLEVTYDRDQSFTVAEPDNGINTFLSPIVGINESSGNWSRALTALTPNIADGSVSGLLTFGQGDATRQAGHMYFVDRGSDGDEYVGFGIRNGAWNVLNITGAGNVGVGTFTPDAKFDVEGGNVRFSDYGEGTYLDVADTLVLADATYALAVDTNGDVVEVNTAKSSKIFYPPAIVIDVSTTGDNRTLDLHQQYVTLYGTPAIVSSGAPAAIPTYGETELFYYVTDYDNAVFSDLEISADGILTYDVDVVPANNCAAFNVVFVVK